MDYKKILYAPREYWELTPEQKAEICNGAGPKGFGFLVPDTIYGLSITEAANIHDYMYHIGGHKYDKLIADKAFDSNMKKIIDKGTWWNWLKKLRNHRADMYYEAVVKFGDAAFNYTKPIHS